MRRPFLAGNWKMNRTVPEAVALAEAVAAAVNGYAAADVVVCPPFVALPAVAAALNGTSIAVGGQNMHWEETGAFTGEVSGPMLRAAGATYVIIGHSERRLHFGETDETVARKLQSALACGLRAIVCVGETLEQHQAGDTFAVVGTQVKAILDAVNADQARGITIAYEPVWAIGTGHTATPEQAEEVHAHIRTLVAEAHGQQVADEVRIQYGGSVKPDNVKDLMACANIDGALVGGASLKAEDFAQVVTFAERGDP